MRLFPIQFKVVRGEYANFSRKVGRSVEEQFKTLKADWRHVDKARWELNFLVCSNDQLAAAHEADSSGNRTRVHRKRTDMFVEGLQPT